MTDRPIWSAREVTANLANAYFAAASVGADMRRAAEALESAREALGRADRPLGIWDLFDDRVGDAHGRAEQAAFVELRQTYVHSLAEAFLEQIRDAYAQSADAGWTMLVTRFAEAAVAWRFDLCRRLIAAPFAAPTDADRAVLSDGIRYALHERWYETYPMYRFLAQQPFLPNAERARFLAIQGQIELYHLLRPGQARALVAAALERAPEDPQVVTAEGECLLTGGEIDEARSRFQRAVSLDPKWASPYCQLGDCCLGENDLAAAETWYRHAIRLRPGDTSAYGRLCQLHGKRGDAATEDPIPDLADRVSVIDPTAVYGFLISAGGAYQERQSFPLAHDWYQRAIARDPARLGGYTSEAYLFLEQGRLDEARSAFTKAIELAPEALDGPWGMARVEEQAEAWRDAERWYLESLPRRPEWAAVIHACLARMRSKQGQLDAAEQAALHAIRLDASDESVLSQVERVAEDAARVHGDTDAALRIYRGIRASVGESYEGCYENQIGILLSAAGKHGDAATAFAAAVAADPEKVSYRVSLARTFRVLGDWDAGRALWDTTPRPIQSDSSLRAEMALLRNAEANACFSKREYAKAIPLYEQAIAFTPSDPVLHSNLAQAVGYDRSEPDANKRFQVLHAALREAVRLNPSNQEYQERLANLEQMSDLYPLYGNVGLDRLPMVTPIAVEVAADLIPLVEGKAEGGLTEPFLALINAMRGRLQGHYGVRIPGVRVRGNTADLPAGSYIIMLMEVPIVMGTIRLDWRFCPAAKATLDQLKIPCEPASGPAGREGCWVSEAHTAAVGAAGLPLWEVAEYPVRHVEAVLERNLAELFGVSEVHELVKEVCPALAPELAAADGGLPVLTGALRALLASRVPIREFRRLCEQYLTLRRTGVPVGEIVEALRSLPELRPLLPGNTGGARFFSMGQEFERRLMDAVYTDGPPVLAMLPEACQEALSQVRERVSDTREAVLLVDLGAVRPWMRKLIELEWPDVPVLSREELVPEVAAAAGAAAIFAAPSFAEATAADDSTRASKRTN